MEDLLGRIDMPRSRNPDMLLKALPSLTEHARKELANGDEEKAFIYYMKFFEAFKIIRSSKEYGGDPKYYDNMIGRKNLKDVMERCEQLSTSLTARYQAQQDKQRELKEKQEVSAERKKVAESPSETALTAFGPKQLYQLMEQKATSFLVLDCRPTQDFEASCLQGEYSLNVPAENINPGLTAKKLETNMTIDKRKMWKRRCTVDKLILLDWFSDEIREGSKLAHLRDAMFKWDQGINYKCGEALLLKGGFFNFLNTYPMKVCGPQAGKKLAKELQKATKVKVAMPTLTNIEYPSFSENGFIAAPGKSLDPAIESGAITVVHPAIPDRSSKPKFPDVSNEKPNNANVSAQLLEPRVNEPSYADMTSKDSSSSLDSDDDTDPETVMKPPVVDRSSKAKMVLAQGDRETSRTKVLEAEDDLVEASVQRERDQLKLENEWQKLRRQRENEASEEMKAEMLRKEEMLLEELKRKEKEGEDKNKEIANLRKNLEQLKVNFTQQEKMTKQLEEEKAMAKSIKEKEQEQQRLHAEVEKKRLERKRKEREVKNKDVGKTAQITRQPLKDEGSSRTGSSLNKSHSSPNIVELLAQEESVSAPTPRFSRDTKPSVIQSPSRQINLMPVWQRGTGKKGLTGLKNLGNTCYMNSVLQCLSNFTIPSQYFMDQTFQRDLNKQSETYGEVALEYSELVRQLWIGQFKSISPYDMKRVIGKFRPEFRGSSQQDAHEFLMVLMGFLHADVNEVRGKVRLPEKDFTKLPEDEAAQASWEFLKQVDRSFIVETFKGQWLWTLECQTCGHKSTKYESFLELPLLLPPGNGRCSLHQCLRQLLSPETVDYSCVKCKRERRFTKSLTLIRLPLILTVHFARFYEDPSAGAWRKKQNYVDFELSSFNAGQYVKGCGGRYNMYQDYKLYGVCNHFGSMEGGHYTAYCYSQVYGKWHKYDDHDVTPMSPSDVKTSAAYMLFYSIKN